MLYPCRLEIVPLDRLPWPHGLGKSDYRELNNDMKEMFGERWVEPTVHEEAFRGDARYREVVDRRLRESGFDETLTAAITEAAGMARTMPLPRHRIERRDWYASVDSYLENLGRKGLSGSTDPAAYYLTSPCKVSSGNQIGDGRHRLTWMRLRHLDGTGPSEILVQYLLD